MYIQEENIAEVVQFHEIFVTIISLEVLHNLNLLVSINVGAKILCNNCTTQK